jgi:hypothetical protein
MRTSAVRTRRSIRGVSLRSLRLWRTKPAARVSPLLETRAVTPHRRLQFEEHTGQYVVVRFEHAELLSEPADFIASLGRQFRLPLNKLCLLRFETRDSCCIVSHFNYLRMNCLF